MTLPISALSGRSEPVSSTIRILQGFLTPLIAFIASFIAWQQLKTNRQKFTLDRFMTDDFGSTMRLGNF
jgi:hypothetical protein